MLPACVVQRSDGKTPQGPLLCRGASTLEANTSYARAAEALYGPTYSGSLAPAMLMPGIDRLGLQVLGETARIGGSTYREVVLGSAPEGRDKPVTVRAPGPNDATQCLGTRVTDKVPSYFDATDPKQGHGGAVYCLPANIRAAPHTPAKQVEPDGASTAAG